jgi:hypothetical protein
LHIPTWKKKFSQLIGGSHLEWDLLRSKPSLRRRKRTSVDLPGPQASRSHSYLMRYLLEGEESLSYNFQVTMSFSASSN